MEKTEILGMDRLEDYILAQIVENIEKNFGGKQKKLAIKMGVKEAWLSKVLNRKIKLKVEDLEKFSEGLNIRFVELFPSHLILDIQKSTIPELIRFFCLREIQSYLKEIGYPESQKRK
jgi:transcriptional regulator with XRE-family HTH domain